MKINCFKCTYNETLIYNFGQCELATITSCPPIHRHRGCLSMSSLKAFKEDNTRAQIPDKTNKIINKHTNI